MPKPRRVFIDVKKETKESISVNNWDKYYLEIAKRVEDIGQLLVKFNSKASYNGGNYIAVEIAGKLYKLEAYIRGSRTVFRELRKYRKTLWDIMKEERNKKNVKIP